MVAYRGKCQLDLALVIVAAPIWIPLLLLIASVVLLGLGRPLFFVQERPGYRGRSFRLIKFRTMTMGRDEHGSLLPDQQRLTRFGRFVRSTSLDELPELLNVLQGDMSLVGPRPLLVEYLPLYSSRQARRHDVRPGITGWAQVSGRNLTSWDTRLEQDVWYVEHASLGLDLRILIRTPGTVFRRHGISPQGQVIMNRFTGPLDDE